MRYDVSDCLFLKLALPAVDDIMTAIAEIQIDAAVMLHVSVRLGTGKNGNGHTCRFQFRVPEHWMEQLAALAAFHMRTDPNEGIDKRGNSEWILRLFLDIQRVQVRDSSSIQQEVHQVLFNIIRRSVLFCIFLEGRLGQVLCLKLAWLSSLRAENLDFARFGIPNSSVAEKW